MPNSGGIHGCGAMHSTNSACAEAHLVANIDVAELPERTMHKDDSGPAGKAPVGSTGSKNRGGARRKVYNISASSATTSVVWRENGSSTVKAGASSWTAVGAAVWKAWVALTKWFATLAAAVALSLFNFFKHVCLLNIQGNGPQHALLFLFTYFGGPTNHIMLAYRTVAQDLKEQPCNEDHLAAQLRDALMPNRGWVHHRLPFLLHAYRWFLQSPLVGCPGIIDFVDTRTRWFDEKVAAALDKEGFKQVVVVAGGYDTRAYRLGSRNRATTTSAAGSACGSGSFPLASKSATSGGTGNGVQFFEVDLPAASATKRRLVEQLGLLKGCEKAPVYVAADLAEVSLDKALQATGFDPSAKTLFTCEGLLYYLPAPAVDNLLRAISRLSAPGSRIVFDILDEEVQDGSCLAVGYQTLMLTVHNKGEELLSGMPTTPAALSSYLEAATGGLLKLRQLVGPKELSQQLLPQKVWCSWCPPLPTFFHYCVAEKV